MAVSSREVAGEVASVLDTSSAKLVVDVGGASGVSISAILMKNRALTGAILERPEVVPRAQAAIAERGLGSRCKVFEGNFFLSLPEADIFLLKHVIHDWDDDQSIRILSNCARALRTGRSRRAGPAGERLRERSITRGFEYARFTPGTRAYPTGIRRFDLSCGSSS